MGDMARYRDQFTKSAMPVAKKMYIKSVLLAPLEGSPFNQLSILSASSGEFLLALFFAYRRYVKFKSSVSDPIVWYRRIHFQMLVKTHWFYLIAV